MQSADRRKKRVPTGTIWLAAVGTALLIHGTVLGAADGIGFSLVGEGFAATSGKQQAELVDLETSCSGDVLLTTAARAAACMAPWQRDQAQCTEDLQMMMWMDLSACLGRDQAIAPVAMTTVQPREIEKLVAIDPEPLLEELQQQEKPPPPPPQPQLQPNTPPPPPPPAPPPPKRPQQVVETAKPNTEQEPDNARFLAEHNTKVEKQKVARGTPKEPMVAKSKPEELKAVDKPKDEPSIAKKPDMDPGKNPKAPPVPGTLTMRKPGAPQPQEVPQDARQRGERGPKQPIVANGGIPRRGDGAIEQQRRDPGQHTKGGEGGAGGGTPQVPNLKPTKEQLERIVGGGNVDHLEEVENGDETALNAKRWVFASFFNRMKRQVAQNWDPQTVWRRSDPSGQKHGFKTRVTEVRVSLSSKGQMSKIVVTSGSGVQELDDEAVRSFHAAAPFPNPPDGLVGKDGSITFAFSFYFEIGAPRTAWRVIRQ